jgi:hypothetical protein
MIRKLTKRKVEKYRAIDLRKSRKAKILLAEAEKLIEASKQRAKVNWDALNKIEWMRHC